MSEPTTGGAADAAAASTAAAHSTTPATPPPRRRSRAARWTFGSLLVLLIAVAATIGVAWWALSNDAGTRWASGLLPRTTVVNGKGSLLGDYAADRIEIDLGGAGILRLERPRWHALAASRGTDGRWLRIVVDSLQVDRLLILPPHERPKTASNEPATLPSSLRLPIEIEVRAASIGELYLGDENALALRDVHGRIHLGADQGRQHRFEQLSARLERGQASGLAAIGSDAPFPVEAALDFISADASLPWLAHLTAKGPLATLPVQAALRLPASEGHAAQALDANAVIRPLASWPLGELDLRTAALDLAALSGALPVTSLSGSAVVKTTGLDRPALIEADFANGRAGRWDEGLLPVLRLSGSLRTKANDPGVLELRGLQAVLGSAREPGGKAELSGTWSLRQWQLGLQLADVDPAALLGGAPRARVAGRVDLDAKPAANGEQQVELKANIAGPLLDPRLRGGAPRNAQLAVEARIAAGDIELRKAQAALGASKATLSGKLVRNGSDGWRALGKAALAEFDPLPWWPGLAPALAAGASRVDAQADFDLRFGTTTFAVAWPEPLRRLRGQAQLRIADSTLAGAPLAGSARFANDDGSAQLAIDVAAAGNHVQGEGKLARGDGAAAWQLAVDAPRLEPLAPWLRLLPGEPLTTTTAPQLAGSLTLHARADGRWPNLTSRGELQAEALRYGSTQVRQAAAHWQAGSGRDAPIEAEVQLRGVRSAGRDIESAQAHLAGSLRAHRLDVDIASAALPPEWVDALGEALAAPTGSGAAAPTPTTTAPGPATRSRVVLAATGGLIDVDGHASAGWSGQLLELSARSVVAPQRVWLDLHDVRGRVVWGAGAMRGSLEPGSAQVLGATLRWRQATWQASDGHSKGPAQLELEAAVDPLPMAPLLRRLQPDFGWGGDLAVGARVSVHSAGAIVADVGFERARGDLTVSDEYGTETLGISDLRARLTSRDGVWNGGAAIAGGRLGEASASLTARTGSGAVWPSAATPIAGTLEARIAEANNWGRWLPAGWRVGGNLHASASIGGRLGAPEYTGRVEGSKLTVRNFVEGVNVTDGDVVIALQGDRARIERFTAKAGKGTISVEGGADFGAVPTTSLQLRAEHFELLGRVDRRIVATGNASLRLDATTLALDGGFKLDEGLVDFTRSDAPTLSDDVIVVRRPAAPPPAATVAPGSAPLPVAAAASAVAQPTTRKVALDLRVDLGDQLRIRGRGIDSGLRGSLHLTSPNNRLAVSGTITTAEGTYQAYGQKLRIDRGVLAFAGPIENPRLDIEATRPDIDVRAGVLVSGTALQPRVRLFSEPDMSDLDKLSWLVLGRASDTTAGRADTALLQQAALALLSGEGPGVTDRLTQAIGLDSISLRQQTEGDTKETIVSLGKQISKRWYVGYERGINGTTGNWQLIYRLAQRITVRAQAGSDSAVDLTWTLRWR